MSRLEVVCTAYTVLCRTCSACAWGAGAERQRYSASASVSSHGEVDAGACATCLEVGKVGYADFELQGLGDGKRPGEAVGVGVGLGHLLLDVVGDGLGAVVVELRLRGARGLARVQQRLCASTCKLCTKYCCMLAPPPHAGRRVKRRSARRSAYQVAGERNLRAGRREPDVGELAELGVGVDLVVVPLSLPALPPAANPGMRACSGHRGSTTAVGGGAGRRFMLGPAGGFVWGWRCSWLRRRVSVLTKGQSSPQRCGSP